MDSDSRERAARAYRLLTQGKDAAEIAQMAGIPDASTVRSFLNGMSWPRVGTRNRLEDAAGMERGELTLYARGDKVVEAADRDPVVAAIQASPLSRANKRRLELAYLDMLEEREGVDGA